MTRAGVPAPGAVHLSYWTRAATSGANGTAESLGVTWINSSGKTLSVTNLLSPALNGTWQEAATTLAAPTGAATAYLTVNGAQSAGSVVVLDDIYLGP